MTEIKRIARSPQGQHVPSTKVINGGVNSELQKGRVVVTDKVTTIDLNYRILDAINAYA
jgi:hypothetical protein